jgi:adenylate cyclase
MRLRRMPVLAMVRSVLGRPLARPKTMTWEGPSRSSMSAPPRKSDQKLSAILFADIHGYSQLMDRDEAGTIVRVTRSLGMIRTLVGDYGGSVENVAGDGVLALFLSAEQALHFAVEMQREVAKESAWSGGQDPIAYRIGISIGDTVSRAGVLHGRSVNLAARIQALAVPGGICISDSVYRIVKDRPDLTMQSLGKQALKNLAEPVEVYSVSPAAAERAPEPLIRAIAPLAKVTPDSSLAVLPLENVSGDAADVHLCQGIVADIISNLSRFRNLFVTARHSAFLAAAQFSSVREIGHRLGVRYVLSGSFRRVGAQIRIVVDLIEVETENTIWSERYDGSLGDIFAFQDAVTSSTASRLAVQIDAAERRRLAAQAYPSLDAYGLILRGQDLSFRFRPDSNSHARRLFEQARDLDPHYGRSYAAISRTFNVEWRYDWAKDPEGALTEALHLAQQAVEYDDLDARGYSEMGLAHLYKKQHDESLAAYERALELNPNDADLLAEMGDCLVYVRQAERSVQLLQQAIRLNPYHPDSYLWYLGDAYFHLGEYAKTIQTLLKMRDQSEGHRLMASSYALLGQGDDARRHARALLEAHPNFTIDQWRKVPPNKYPEDLEIFVEGLRRAGLQ